MTRNLPRPLPSGFRPEVVAVEQLIGIGSVVVMVHHQGMWVLLIEREVDLQHVDSRFAEESEGAAAGVCIDDRAHLLIGNATLLRNPRNLQLRRRRADVRIETAGRAGHQVDRDLDIVRQPVFAPDDSDIRGDAIDQDGIGRSEIGARRRRGIVARSSRRWSAAEVSRQRPARFGIDEALADQLGADDLAVLVRSASRPPCPRKRPGRPR